jgi:hypothetical protein
MVDFRAILDTILVLGGTKSLTWQKKWLFLDKNADFLFFKLIIYS